MKTIICIAIIAIISYTANAQVKKTVLESSLTIKGGVNITNITAAREGSSFKANSFTGFNFGLIYDLPIISGFSFQGGLVLSGKGSKTELGDPGNIGHYKATANPTYLEVPFYITGKIKIVPAVKLLIGAGPYGAIGIAGQNKLETQALNEVVYSNKDIDYSNNPSIAIVPGGYPNMKRFDYGLNGIAGVEFKRIALTANYGYGLSNVVPGTNDRADDNGKHRVLSLSFGFRI